MTEILNFLTEHFRTVLAVLIITVIAVVVFIVIVLRRSREKPDEKSKTVKAPEEMPAPIASMTQAADLELSFRRGMKTLRGVITGRQMLCHHQTGWVRFPQLFDGLFQNLFKHRKCIG